MTQNIKQTRPKHFLDLDQIERTQVRNLVKRAQWFKEQGREVQPLLNQKILACIFDKNSTRTRISFAVAMKRLGGDVLTLSGDELQSKRGETLSDTARVLSCYVDAIMFRTHAHARLDEMAQNSKIPVINGLTDSSHPCQILADIQTVIEHFGRINGKKIAWIGDGNNVALSWMHASQHFDFELSLGCPDLLAPSANIIDQMRHQGGDINLYCDPDRAVKNADVVVTDTWVSMGDDLKSRHNLLKPYQVNETLMKKANKNAVFMHCLPAHRGEEVSAEVIDGARSLVWSEAENRLYAQMAILEWCMGKE
ncbi:MAG: ornithine carbamoyltransferase [Pseudomonadota bacterium]